MTEYDLILSFKKGNESAFKEVLGMFHGELIYFLNKITYEKTEAEDIAIESFTALFSKCKQFDSIGAIKIYLFTTGRNKALNYVKLTNRLDPHKSEYIDYISNMDAFELEYNIKFNIVEHIYSLIEQLPFERRYIFKMVYLEDKTPTEVAALLGLSPNTVYVQIKRSLDFLKLKLINTP